MVNRSKQVKVLVPVDLTSLRLDKFLRNKFPEWGRSAVSRVIQNRQVRVNGKTVWLASWKIHGGDRVEVNNPPVPKTESPSLFDPDWLIADQGDLIVVNKPAGLLSHATRTGQQDDLLSLSQAAFKENLHLFHRLDRDTSGLCLLTRPGPVNAYLDTAFKKRQVVKEYLAVVSSRGDLEDQGELRDYLDVHPQRSDMMRIVPSGGKFAFTQYWVEAETSQGFKFRLNPHTGRTHQLRVQLAGKEAPIIGDRLYGGARADRLMLHAARIALPGIGGFPAREWVCPVPF